MKPIKIFVDCHVFDGNFQGTTTYLKGLYSELISDKDFYFVLAAKDIGFLKTIFGIHDNVHYVQYKSTNKFLRLLFDIPKIIQDNNIDYAHFQYVVPPLKKSKYIVTIHDVLFLDFPKYFPLPYRMKNKFLFKNAATRSEVVLSVSEYSQKRIQQHFNLKNVFVTPNAVDPVFFDPYDKALIKVQVKEKFKAADYFIFVSRWEPRKNHLNLLKAFVENKHYKKHNLVFVGDKAIQNKAYDDYFSSLTKEIRNKIFTFNKVSFDDLLLLVRGADLSVYPSIAEGFGIPPLESLAANVPTICSNATAMSDFGFFDDCLFNPLKQEELAKKIETGLLDTKTAQKRDKMKAQFSWKLAAEQFKKAIS